MTPSITVTPAKDAQKESDQGSERTEAPDGRKESLGEAIKSKPPDAQASKPPLDSPVAFVSERVPSRKLEQEFEQIEKEDGMSCPTHHPIDARSTTRTPRRRRYTYSDSNGSAFKREDARTGDIVWSELKGTGQRIRNMVTHVDLDSKGGTVHLLRTHSMRVPDRAVKSLGNVKKDSENAQLKILDLGASSITVHRPEQQEDAKAQETTPILEMATPSPSKKGEKDLPNKGGTASMRILGNPGIISANNFGEYSPSTKFRQSVGDFSSDGRTPVGEASTNASESSFGTDPSTDGEADNSAQTSSKETTREGGILSEGGEDVGLEKAKVVSGSHEGESSHRGIHQANLTPTGSPTDC
jgi:hypothetical protein